MSCNRTLNASGAACKMPIFKNIHPTGGNMTIYLPREVSESLTRAGGWGASTLYAYSIRTGNLVGAGVSVDGEQSFPVWAIDDTPNSTTFGAEAGERIGFRVEDKGKIFNVTERGENVEIEFRTNDMFDIRADKLVGIECAGEEPEAEDSGIESSPNPYIKYVLYGAAAYVAYSVFIKK